MDKILIRQLKVDTIIGIHDWEKQIKQPIVIDLTLSFDCSQAAVSDNINDALDYFEICKRITDFMTHSKSELIESLAEKTAQLILKEFPVKKVKLKLYKPEAILNATVGIQIIRKTDAS